MIGLLGIRRHAGLRTLLSSYVDGEISDVEARQVEDHLSTCADCRSNLETLRMSVELLRALPVLAPPRSFALDRVPDFARPSLAPLWATGMATSLAGILLAVLFLGDAVGVLAQTGPADGPSPAESPAAPTAPVEEPAAIAAPVPEPSPAPALELAAAPALAAELGPAVSGPAPKPAAAPRAAVAAQGRTTPAGRSPCEQA